VPAGQGQPPVSRARSEHALGFRLHLCRHPKGVRLFGIRHRRLCTQDRRLAGQHFCLCGFRPRCPRTSSPRTPPGKGHGTGSPQRRGSQYLSIRYTERLAEAGIEPSVGSVGDSYDNALAETINGLFKARVIHRRGPWRSFEAVAYATLEWVDWFNNRRLLEPIGNIPPVEAEAIFCATLETEPMAA